MGFDLCIIKEDNTFSVFSCNYGGVPWGLGGPQAGLPTCAERASDLEEEGKAQGGLQGRGGWPVLSSTGRAPSFGITQSVP